MKTPLLGKSMWVACFSGELRYRSESPVHGWFVWHCFVFGITGRLADVSTVYICTELTTGRGGYVREETPELAYQAMIKKLDEMGLERVGKAIAEGGPVLAMPLKFEAFAAATKDERSP